MTLSGRPTEPWHTDLADALNDKLGLGPDSTFCFKQGPRQDIVTLSNALTEIGPFMFSAPPTGPSFLLVTNNSDLIRLREATGNPGLYEIEGDSPHNYISAVFHCIGIAGHQSYATQRMGFTTRYTREFGASFFTAEKRFDLFRSVSG